MDRRSKKSFRITTSQTTGTEALKQCFLKIYRADELPPAKKGQNPKLPTSK